MLEANFEEIGKAVIELREKLRLRERVTGSIPPEARYLDQIFRSIDEDKQMREKLTAEEKLISDVTVRLSDVGITEFTIRVYAGDPGFLHEASEAEGLFSYEAHTANGDNVNLVAEVYDADGRIIPFPTHITAHKKVTTGIEQ